jgi:hypothetical protein
MPRPPARTPLDSGCDGMRHRHHRVRTRAARSDDGARGWWPLAAARPPRCGGAGALSLADVVEFAARRRPRRRASSCRHALSRRPNGGGRVLLVARAIDGIGTARPFLLYHFPTSPGPDHAPYGRRLVERYGADRGIMTAAATST